MDNSIQLKKLMLLTFLSSGAADTREQVRLWTVESPLYCSLPDATRAGDADLCRRGVLFAALFSPLELSRHILLFLRAAPTDWLDSVLQSIDWGVWVLFSFFQSVLEVWLPFRLLLSSLVAFIDLASKSRLISWRLLLFWIFLIWSYLVILLIIDQWDKKNPEIAFSLQYFINGFWLLI